MKKLHFTNYYYGRLPWYYRFLIMLIFFVPLAWNTFFDFGTFTIPVYFKKIILTTALIVGISAFVFGAWESTRKNAFIHQGDKSFSLRFNGTTTDFKTKDISEISWDNNHILQIRRINRVDTYNLSNFRPKDRAKLKKYIFELADDTETLSHTSLIT